MLSLSEKLYRLHLKLQEPRSKFTILIFGLGSVGCYLLDYLLSTADDRMRIVVAGRNRDKMTSDVNIIRTAVCIRHQLKAEVLIDDKCDLNVVQSISEVLDRWTPDIIVNSSRAYPGLKYGSISWTNFRAYGIWTPLSIKFARNIMLAYEMTGCEAITINTSYSDAVIPWLKSANLSYYDFGSGNLNHLVPRIKFAVADKYACSPSDVDVTIAISHFHDVVISKEGQAEGIDVPLSIKIGDKNIKIDKDAIFKECAIMMPTDAKRNMMNASSNFDIINSIIKSLDGKTAIKVHSPGFAGEIGGYPIFIDARGSSPVAEIDTREFSFEQMQEVNRRSIYLDGIENVSDGVLTYTDTLIEKVENIFDCRLPKFVSFGEIDSMAEFLINNIINK